MPVFIILVLLVAIASWFLLSSLYRPIGRFVCRIWSDAKEQMLEEEPEVSTDDSKIS